MKRQDKDLHEEWWAGGLPSPRLFFKFVLIAMCGKEPVAGVQSGD